MGTRPDQRYPQVWDRDRKRMVNLHRLIAERHLQRPLSSHEVVHHLDGNRHNNDPTNLVVLSSQKVHAHLEALQRKERRGQVLLFVEFRSEAVLRRERRTLHRAEEASAAEESSTSPGQERTQAPSKATPPPGDRCIGPLRAIYLTTSERNFLDC